MEKEIAKELAYKVVNVAYKYLTTKFYGKVGVHLGLTLTFTEAIRLDEWRNTINSLIVSKGGRKNAFEHGLIIKDIKIVEISEDIVGFPLIDLLSEEETELDDEEKTVLLVRRGVIEGYPLCEAKGCIKKAVEVLVDLVSEFQRQYSIALIHIELKFPDINKASTFYRRINSKIPEEFIEQRKIIIQRPYGSKIQISISPFKISLVDIIEDELFLTRMHYYEEQFKEKVVRKIFRKHSLKQ